MQHQPRNTSSAERYEGAPAVREVGGELGDAHGVVLELLPRQLYPQRDVVLPVGITGVPVSMPATDTTISVISSGNRKKEATLGRIAGNEVPLKHEIHTLPGTLVAFALCMAMIDQARLVTWLW